MTKVQLETGSKLPSINDLATCSALLQKKILKSKNKGKKHLMKEIRQEIEWLINAL